MTAGQITLARHALGLPNNSRRSYRNRFYASPGHKDYDAWMDMVSHRLATQHDDLFVLTLSGATIALEAGEKLDPEDFPV